MSAPSASKLATPSEACALVRDGSVVGIHGASTQGSPMALIRELIRAGRRKLRIVTLGGSIGIDWLAASGAIAHCTFCVIGMEQFGMCQAFRRGVETHAISVEELSETGLYARLGAAARGLPFLPTRAMVGSDLLEVGNENVRVIDDPFGGPPLVACRALHPDVAIIHAHRADAHGNVAIEPSVRYPTMTVMSRAATRVIVSVEEVVSTDELREAPDRTVIPGFLVDAVVELPFGAHPTSLFPRYTYDASMHEEWATVASHDEFLDRYVCEPASHEQYLERVGGRERLETLLGGSPR